VYERSRPPLHCVADCCGRNFPKAADRIAVHGRVRGSGRDCTRASTIPRRSRLSTICDRRTGGERAEALVVDNRAAAWSQRLTQAIPPAISREISMNSFTLTAVGNLARNPELVVKGDTTYARLCLIGSDYAGKDEDGASREIVTSLWFVAFGPLGETIARRARKGDQLIVEAYVRANQWTNRQGERQYDHSFVVQGFRFGAPGRVKREALHANGKSPDATPAEGSPPLSQRHQNGRNA
jgi:single-strand DNA-binding protein